jgi:hypothetical protein
MILYNDGTNITEPIRYITALSAGNISANNISLTTTLPVSSGGTGSANLTLGSVVVGNNTGTVTLVSPGTTGNVLVSNGTTWISQAPAASGITTGKAIAMAMIFGF